MGEAKRREMMGLPPRGMANQPMQITINPSRDERVTCECGCDLFVSVIEAYRISALVSPVGQEMLAQRPVLACLKCNKVLMNADWVKESNAPTPDDGKAS